MYVQDWIECLSTTSFIQSDNVKIMKVIVVW
jgi:hypothetical protein